MHVRRARLLCYDGGLTIPWAEQSLLDRMETAVERVRDRLPRATAALEAASVPYAVVGSSAVAAWIESVDRDAVRNTRHVEILLSRESLTAAEDTLSASGFRRSNAIGSLLFLDQPWTRERDAICVVTAGEVQPLCASLAPDVSDRVERGGFYVLALEPLGRMNLETFPTE